ncbi:nuclear transport factor 2 family protein [Mycolicibacterium murale]|nr:nuclear transport factor 2 family protein [Mycolicibacterium murale]
MTNTEWETLPDTVKTFMTALDARQVEQALATLTADAVVTDDGRDHTGTDEIGTWVATEGAQFTYTTASPVRPAPRPGSSSGSIWRATSPAASST